jgi:hypothetical protein
LLAGRGRVASRWTGGGGGTSTGPAPGAVRAAVSPVFTTVAFAVAAAACGGDQRTAVLRNDPAARRDLGHRVDAVVQVMAASPAGIRHGSGFVVDDDGLVVTASDLLHDASTIFVRFPSDDAYFRAAPVALAEHERLGALRIDGGSFPALRLDPDHRAPVGSRVTAVGSAVAPAAAAHPARVRQRLDPGGYYLLEAAGPIPAAAAGGPVFDRDGAVVGALARWTLDGRVRDVVVPTERIARVVGSAAATGEIAVAAVGPPEPRWRSVSDERPWVTTSGSVPPESGGARAAARRPASGSRRPAEPQASPVPPRPARAPRETAAPRSADPVADAPDLSGSWIVTNVVREHPHPPFRGLRLGFRFDVVQHGSRVSGTGVKVSENGRPVSGTARSPIRFDGRLDGRTLTATFRERGARRTITGVFAWTVSGDGRTLRGSFHDASLGAGGSSTGRRG